MDKRFKRPVNQKPNFTDSPYYRGAAGVGVPPYYKHHPNKSFNRQHSYHTGTVRPNKYYKQPIGPQNATNWRSRRNAGGAMAPPSGASNPSDVVTLIVDNNNLKRMVVLHVNLMQEQSKKLSAKDKELDEQNIKINTLYAQNQEMKLLNAQLEASLQELRKELRLGKQTRHRRCDDDDDDDDDDTSLMPPVKISRHMETQTNLELAATHPKPDIATVQPAKVEQQQHQPYQQPQPQSQVQERLVTEPVRPEAKEQEQQQNRPTHDPQHSHQQPLPIPNVPKSLDTSLTSLSPRTPIDIRQKLGRGEFNGKKVSTMFLHRVNQDSSLTTSTTIINSYSIEPDPEVGPEKEQMHVDQTEEEVQTKEQEGDLEHETSKEDIYNHLESHEMEVVSETIVGAEEEVIEEMVEEEVINDETTLVEEVVGHMDEGDQVVVDRRFEDRLLNVLVVEEHVIEQQSLARKSLAEHLLPDEEVVEEEQLIEQEVVEEQLVQEEEHVEEDRLIQQDQVVEDQLVERPDANGHLEIDEYAMDEQYIKANNVDGHSPQQAEKHQIFGLSVTEAPSAHSTPNHQLKVQLEREEQPQEQKVVKNDQVEMEMSTVEYFTDDDGQEEIEIHTEKEVTTKKTEMVNDASLSNDNKTAATLDATTNTQAPLFDSVSEPTPAAAPIVPPSAHNSIPKPKTTKLNSMAVAPTSETALQHSKLRTSIAANHQTAIRPRPKSPEFIPTPLKQKCFKLKLRQCVMPTQKKKTKVTVLNNDNHDIEIEEKTQLKLHEHLEKQQRRQSLNPLVVLKKKSSDDASSTDLIFPPTAPIANPITPASTPVNTPSTTPVSTPTSSIESSAAVDVEAEVEAEEPIRSVNNSEEKPLQAIVTPLTPQSISSASSSNSTNSTNSRKTPKNLHQTPSTYGKAKSSSNVRRFLTTTQPYTTRSWEDQDIHCDNEFFLEEANELLEDNPSLEIPKWHDSPIPPSSDSKDIEPLSDADFVKRHEKYVKDEIERKRRDERFLREQIRSKELRIRHKQDEVILPLDPLPISTFYPLPEDIEGVQFVNEVPVQVFGENMITLDSDEFSLPWIEEVTAATAAERTKAQSLPVATLTSKKLPTTIAEQKHQELNSSYVFIKRRKRRKAGKSGIFGGT